MSGGVFINYRSEDSRSYGALLHAELSRILGRHSVFLDSESIPAGCDFVTELLARVRRSRVLLAVIGPRWLAGTGPGGRRHIDNADDWIRRELAEAFAAGTTVIPILTDEADLPTAEELPPDIAALARRQYRRLRHREASADIARIVKDVIEADPELAAAVQYSPADGLRALARVSLAWPVIAGVAVLGLIITTVILRPIHGTPMQTTGTGAAASTGWRDESPPSGCPPPPPGGRPPHGYPPPWDRPPGDPDRPPQGDQSRGGASPAANQSPGGPPPANSPPGTPQPSPQGSDPGTSAGPGDPSGTPGRSSSALAARLRTGSGSRLL